MIIYDNLDKTALGAFQTTARVCFMGLAVVMNERVGSHKNVDDLRLLGTEGGNESGNEENGAHRM